MNNPIKKIGILLLIVGSYFQIANCGGSKLTRNLKGLIRTSSLPALSLDGQTKQIAAANVQVCCFDYKGNKGKVFIGSVDADGNFTVSDLPIDEPRFCGFYTGTDSDSNGCKDTKVASLGYADRKYHGAIEFSKGANDSTDDMDLGTVTITNDMGVSTTDVASYCDSDGDGTTDDKDTDDDGDGKADGVDTFDKVGFVNADQIDVDGDKTPDITEASWNKQPDTDNDGIPNGCDFDVDGDGINNDKDTDDDGDGILDTADDDDLNDGVNDTGVIDTDSDGIPNALDLDCDNDGIDNKTDTDDDGDGIPDSADTDADGDGVADASETDKDGDGLIDAVDSDIDGDGIANSNDPDIDGDGILNVDDTDDDGDGIPDSADSDKDGNGISDSASACTLAGSECNNNFNCQQYSANTKDDSDKSNDLDRTDLLKCNLTTHCCEFCNSDKSACTNAQLQ